MKNTPWVHAEMAQLLGLLTSVEHGHASWWDFEVQVQRVTARLWDGEASKLRDNLVEDLGRAAEQAEPTTWIGPVSICRKQPSTLPECTSPELPKPARCPRSSTCSWASLPNGS